MLRILRIARTASTALFLATATILAGCGGGGGGGSSGGGGGSGSGPPSASSQWPRNLSASFPEGLVQSTELAHFDMYAPSNELPTNVQLVGNDGSFFQVSISASATPTSTGYRTVYLTVGCSCLLDYEDPKDANKDNVYEFALTGQFRGETLRSEITVTITDVPGDPAITYAGLIVGPDDELGFGANLTAIPDVTGDAKEDLLVGTAYGPGTAAGYLLASDYLISTQLTRRNVTPLGSAGARFRDAASATPPKANWISGAPIMSGGADVAVSIANQVHLFDALTAASYAPLVGDVNLESANTPGITYSFATGTANQGRVIGDANGDGRNDLFIRDMNAATSRSYGIIFGRAATGPSDHQRNATPDLTFTYTNGAPYSPCSSAFGPTCAPLEAQLVPDLDGDGQKDLVILDPSVNRNGFGQSGYPSGAIWVIWSETLRDTATTTVNLDTMDRTKGMRLIGVEWLHLEVLPDFDSDGHATFVLAHDPQSSNLSVMIDSNDFAALPNIEGLYGTNNMPGATTLASYPLTSVGDLNHDGLSEYISGAGGTFAALMLGSTLRGVALHQIDGGNPPVIQLNFQERAPQGFATLPNTGILAAWMPFRGTGASIPPSYIALMKISDLEKVIQENRTSVDVKLR